MPLAALIPAIVGGVGAIGGALISSSAVNSASGAATAAASANNALQAQIYNSNKALAAPYVNAGDAANTELQGFLGLGGDAAASQAALDTYLNATGYQFNRQQGLDAVEQSKAAAGLLNSGATLEALDNYATGEADQYGQQYEQNLQGVVNAGQAAVTGLTGAGENFANQAGANNNSAATVQGNAAIAGANIDTSLIANALKAYAYGTGQSSYGGGGSGPNAFAPGG